MSDPAQIPELPPAIPLTGGDHLGVENIALKMELCRERMAGLQQQMQDLSGELIEAQEAAISKAAAHGITAEPAVGKARLYIYDMTRKTLVLRTRPSVVGG